MATVFHYQQGRGHTRSRKFFLKLLRIFQRVDDIATKVNEENRGLNLDDQGCENTLEESCSCKGTYLCHLIHRNPSTVMYQLHY